MKKPERDALIAGIINKIIRKKEAEHLSTPTGITWGNTMKTKEDSAITLPEGKWYFYNQLPDLRSF